MTQLTEPLVFDTGPLRHFAEAGWLGVLRLLAANRSVIVPDSVTVELVQQSHSHSALRQVLDATWITFDRSRDIPYLAAFSRFEERLVVDGRNRGECGVLAMGEVRGFEVVLDDSTARTVAEECGMEVSATLPLLCHAIRADLLTVPMVEQLADHLLETEYFLPFAKGGFRLWALQEGLIDYI